MTDYYVSSAKDPHSSAGNAGTIGDPMGLQEGLNAQIIAGDRVYIMDDGTYDLSSDVTLLSALVSSSPREVIGVNSSGVEDGSRSIINQTLGNKNCIKGSSSKWYYIKNLDLRDRNRAGIHSVTDSVFENCISPSADSGSLIEGCDDSTIISCEKTDDNGSGWLCDCLTGGIIMIDCYATNCLGLIRGNASSRRGIVVDGCVADGCSNSGVKIGCHDDSGISIVNTISINNDLNGIELTATSDSTVYVKNCIMYGNTSSGFNTAGGTGDTKYLLSSNISVNNGEYGYKWESTNIVISTNCYGYNNTSGLTTGNSSFMSSIQALTADPFVDAVGDDFFINDVAGGGTTLREDLVTNTHTSINMGYPFRQFISTLSSGGGTTAYFG